MTKVLALTRYTSLGASSRVRFYQHLPALAQAGYQVSVSPLFDNDYLSGFYSTGQKSPWTIAKAFLRRTFSLLRKNSADILWIEKEILPYIPFSMDEFFLNYFQSKVIIDFDDAIFHNYDLNQNLIVRKLLKNKISSLMKRAGVIVAGSQYIADYASSAGCENVKIVPSAVEAPRIRPVKHDGIKVTIGWIGSPSTVIYLKNLFSVFAKLSEHYDFNLLIIGSQPPEGLGIEAQCVPWSLESEANMLSQIDIGIMPLSDSSWCRGKCGYKLLQYMANGIPAVASPIGENCRIVKHNVNGLLASTPDEWIASLSKLIEEKPLRETLGARGRLTVEGSYTLEKVSPNLIQIFDELK